jgi:hypothetical protein
MTPDQIKALIQEKAYALATALGCRPEDPKRQLVTQYMTDLAALLTAPEPEPEILENPPEKSE